MVKHLNEIKEKKKWKWDKEYQKSFEKLKDKITSYLVLTLSKREGKFEVETDISEYAIRGVLSQEQKKKWKHIIFLLRTIQPAKKNYEIYDKKLLTIVEALTK